MYERSGEPVYSPHPLFGKLMSESFQNAYYHRVLSDKRGARAFLCRAPVHPHVDAGAPSADDGTGTAGPGRERRAIPRALGLSRDARPIRK